MACLYFSHLVQNNSHTSTPTYRSQLVVLNQTEFDDDTMLYGTFEVEQRRLLNESTIAGEYYSLTCDFMRQLSAIAAGNTSN